MRPELPSDPAPQQLELSCGVASLVDEGEGPALIAIHGLPGSHRDFRWLSPCLQGLRCIRPDMPGFGRTPLSCGPDPSPAGCADFVVDLLDGLGLDQVVVLSHSAAGAVVVELAARAPERLRGLVLLASIGLRPHKLRRRSPLRLLRAGLRLPAARRVLLPLVRAGFQAAGFPRGIGNQAVHRSVLQGAAISFDRISETLPGLELPTAVAWAEDDPFIETEVSRELGRRAPLGPRLVFQEGGHNIQKTQALEIGATLVPWVRGLFTEDGSSPS